MFIFIRITSQLLLSTVSGQTPSGGQIRTTTLLQGSNYRRQDERDNGSRTDFLLKLTLVLTK